MNKKLALYVENGIGVFKYVLAAIMIVAGISTMVAPLDPELGLLFGHRAILIFYGVTFMFSGAALLYGKVRRSRKWTGLGLLFIYLCFTYAAILNGIAWGFGDLSAWLPNTIMALIVGALYIRWRFQTVYVNPRHFTRDLRLPDFKDASHERY